MRRLACSIAVVLAAGVSFFSFGSHAAACGGCFAPTGQPSVVTAHRMVVGLSATQTTLWDQFEYAGEPEDFVWVLPVDGEQDVQVELAEQEFFRWLQLRTAVTLQGPTRFAGGGGSGGGFGCGAADASAGGAGAMGQPRVTVYNSEVVGPYDTVTIGSEDAGALVTWLQDNGYAIPDELTPTIMHYVDQGMNFVVLRLSPGAGVQQMQPVRVTTPGMHVAFPLRMVAAGVADEVSLELYVIADGRYHAQNFANVEMREDHVTYDWATNAFDYDEVADDHLASSGGRTWLTEFAMPTGGVTTQLYDPVDRRQIEPTDDWFVATDGLPDPWITRMRAVLPVEALGEDLVLEASLAGERSGFYNITNEINATSPVAPLFELGAGGDAPKTPVYLLVFALGLAAALLRRRAAHRLA